MIQEVVLKMLSGRGKVDYFLNKIICINNISKTLGCWIINFIYEVEEKDKAIYLKGEYSLQIWYALNDNQTTSVYEEKISFYEEVKMAYRDLVFLDEESFIKVYVNKYPTCINMALIDNKIDISIEGLFFFDVFKNAITKIETKENLQSDLTLEEEILLNVNPNYLTNK